MMNGLTTAPSPDPVKKKGARIKIKGGGEVEGGGVGRRGRSTDKQGKTGKERSQAHCWYRSPREARTLSSPPSQHLSGHPPCHHYLQKMQET